MREKLYKAKRKDNGEWVEGFLFQYLGEEPEWCIGTTPLCANDHGEIIGQNQTWFIVDKDTICEYTGWTDDKNTKIWEHDICNCVADGEVHTRVIAWDEEELDFKGTNGRPDYGREFNYIMCCEGLEIIGNIFDNPELLSN